ncbi:MAG: FeoA family protein [Candidatus Bathyarchaeia archaeon]
MMFRNRGNAKKQNDSSVNEQIIPLTSLNEEEKGIIHSAAGGFGLVRRLAEMGLTPGVEVKMLRKGPFHGPVEIEVRGVALALGFGVASKIFVKPLKAEANA